LIRDEVVRAIALNRDPGFHFAGNLAELSYESTAADSARVEMGAAAHVVDPDGQVNLGLVAMLLDMSLAASIRAGLHPATWLVTVSLSIQLTGARRDGLLSGLAEFKGWLGESAARQGLARATLTSGSGLAAIAHGAFMALDPPDGVAAFPLPRGKREAPAIRARDYTADERRILRRADKVLAGGESDFIRRFLGYEAKATASGSACTMTNGSHVGNRVGHVQGGLLMGLAAASAQAALPAEWSLSAINCFFVSPGQGNALRARSRIVHRGSMTAVVRTEITGPGGRRVLETTTAHARR